MRDRQAAAVPNLDGVLTALKDMVRQAGRIMFEAPRARIESHEKSGWGDFVTQYDVKVQTWLAAAVADRFPNAAFKGEEAGLDRTALAGDVFIADPIDGTLNFIRGREQSAVSVAFCRDGELHAGAVYDPWRDELFSAVKGGGAYLNDRPIHVSDWPFDGGLITMGTASYYKEISDCNHELLNFIWEHAVDIRRTGTASLDLCYVACGRTDLYCELRLMPWDYAAGTLIVQEAGGCSTQVNGRPVNLERGGSLLAGNPLAYDEFRRLAADSRFIGL